MKHYCNLYNNIQQYLSEGCDFHPETLLKYNLKDKQVSRLNCETYIVRYLDNKYVEAIHA